MTIKGDINNKFNITPWRNNVKDAELSEDIFNLDINGSRTALSAFGKNKKIPNHC